MIWFTREQASYLKKLKPLTNLIILKVLDFLSGSDLIELTRAFGGSVVVKDDELHANGTIQVEAGVLRSLVAKQPYQAIIVLWFCQSIGGFVRRNFAATLLCSQSRQRHVEAGKETLVLFH
jgi:hypothetical protein